MQQASTTALPDQQASRIQRRVTQAAESANRLTEHYQNGEGTSERGQSLAEKTNRLYTTPLSFSLALETNTLIPSEGVTVTTALI